jgi:hypothetical protein
MGKRLPVVLRWSSFVGLLAAFALAMWFAGGARAPVTDSDGVETAVRLTDLPTGEVMAAPAPLRTADDAMAATAGARGHMVPMTSALAISTTHAAADLWRGLSSKESPEAPVWIVGFDSPGLTLDALLDLPTSGTAEAISGAFYLWDADSGANMGIGALSATGNWSLAALMTLPDATVTVFYATDLAPYNVDTSARAVETTIATVEPATELVVSTGYSAPVVDLVGGADFVAELIVEEMGPTRYNTNDGQLPYWSYETPEPDWMSPEYIAYRKVRLQIQDGWKGTDGLEGVVTVELGADLVLMPGSSYGSVGTRGVMFGDVSPLGMDATEPLELDLLHSIESLLPSVYNLVVATEWWPYDGSNAVRQDGSVIPLSSLRAEIAAALE